MKRLPILQLILLWLLSCSQLALADRITYFYYDATGTAIMAKDEQANVLWKRAPTAYGETPEVHPAMKKYNHRMTVAGHYDDWETGLIYMGKRYYSPKLGRFLTPDPVGVHLHLPQSFNRYKYANNNPYRYIDPDGRFDIDINNSNCIPFLEGGCQHRGGGGGGGFSSIGSAKGGKLNVNDPSNWGKFHGNSSYAESARVGSNIPNSGTSVANSAKSFRNLAPGEPIGYAKTFPVSQIPKVSYSGRLNYVVMESGTLVIGRTGHTSLSGGGNVLAAGEARFVNGELRSLNNASGHYKPSGLGTQNAAESAFQRAGFESLGKYVEKKF